MKSATGAVQMQIKMKIMLWNNDEIMMKLIVYILYAHLCHNINYMYTHERIATFDRVRMKLSAWLFY